MSDQFRFAGSEFQRLENRLRLSDVLHGIRVITYFYLMNTIIQKIVTDFPTNLKKKEFEKNIYLGPLRKAGGQHGHIFRYMLWNDLVTS